MKCEIGGFRRYRQFGCERPRRPNKGGSGLAVGNRQDPFLFDGRALGIQQIEEETHAAHLNLETFETPVDPHDAILRLLFVEAVMVAHDDAECFGRSLVGAAGLEADSLLGWEAALHRLIGLAGRQTGRQHEKDGNGCHTWVKLPETH